MTAEAAKARRLEGLETNGDGGSQKEGGGVPSSGGTTVGRLPLCRFLYATLRPLSFIWIALDTFSLTFVSSFILGGYVTPHPEIALWAHFKKSSPEKNACEAQASTESGNS